MSNLLKSIHRHRAWLVMTLVILLVSTVRLRLREMPLERDEGEYAYSGQLILQGIPPYKLAYNMKFPGIYAAYALVMLVFGQTAAGVHLGLLMVNVASIVLMFFLGRKLLDLNGGLIAAATFAVLSLSASVLGLAGHASHFVVLAALGGTLVLLRAAESRKASDCFASGALFGVAFLMKQPGLFWGIFGLLYLAWLEFRILREFSADRRSSSRREAARTARSESERGVSTRAGAPPSRERLTEWKPGILRCGWYCLGMAVPFLLMCLLLRAAGVFDKFTFWTFTYAREYVSVHPLFKIPAEELRQALGAVIGPNLPLWILAGLGAVLMWWDESLQNRRHFLGGFIAFSLLAICPGWYFRQHYFVFLLPAASLLAGIAVNRGLHLLKHDRTIELFLAVPMLGLFAVGLVAVLIGNGSVWFELTPAAACREVYEKQMFPEEAELGDYIKAHAAPDARIAVLGSEPEIYFCSRRHSASGFIYMYPLMEQHKFALTMQEEMIREIETARPEYLVYVKVDESWLLRPESERRILTWYEQYSKAHYDLVKMIKAPASETSEADSAAPGRTPGYLLLYERKR